MYFQVIKYHVEARDNAKFLGSIEKSSHSIYLLDPSRMQVSIFLFLAAELLFNSKYLSVSKNENEENVNLSTAVYDRRLCFLS